MATNAKTEGAGKRPHQAQPNCAGCTIGATEGEGAKGGATASPRRVESLSRQWARYFTAPGPFFEQWRADSDAGEPNPTRATIAERIRRTLDTVGYSLRKFDAASIANMPRIQIRDENGHESMPRPRPLFSRKKFRSLLARARRQISRLKATLGEIEQGQVKGIPSGLEREVVLLKVLSGRSNTMDTNAIETLITQCSRGWFHPDDRKRYADTLAEIDSELGWQEKAPRGKAGPRQSMTGDGHTTVNEWVRGFRDCGLSDPLVAEAMKTLGLEGAGDAKDRVRHRRKRLK